MQEGCERRWDREHAGASRPLRQPVNNPDAAVGSPPMVAQYLAPSQGRDHRAYLGGARPCATQAEHAGGGVEPDASGDSKGRHTRTRGKGRTSGGFHVDFDHQGEAATRAMYVAERRTIYINLDFPQLAAARVGP